jgi:hypothetical protein
MEALCGGCVIYLASLCTCGQIKAKVWIFYAVISIRMNL